MPRAAGNAPKKPAVKKGAKGHVLPQTLPEGEILTDTHKKSWRLGPPVGIGGFGAVYAASEVETNSGDSYVIKIEPHENGPLFVEMHFYMKCFKPEDIQQWMKEKKFNYLGIPQFYGHGSHHYNGEKYRFIVIERFGKNIHSIFKNNKKLSPVAAFQLGAQIVNILEFIHSRGYCHADIKGDNLLLGLKKGSENQVFLVDFGLAEKCVKAKEKPDPKKAHNGTAEYTSRDAHRGVVAKRGDLEILAYNMLHWMSSKLPWEKHIADCVRLAELKEEYMSDVDKLMKTCFGTSKPPDALVKFFKFVAKMDYDKIDYYRCRSICVEGLKALKSGVDKPLDIDVSASDEPKVRAGVKGKGRKRRSTAGSNTEQSRKKVVKESGRKGAAASKAAGSQKTETTETETSEETEVIETTSSNDDCHDENISNGYIDIPDSPGPSLKPSKVKRGPRNRRKSILASGIASSSMGRRKSVSLKRGPLNRRKSIVASGIASSSMGRRKSVGLKKRRSVVVKELLSAAKAVSWRDCPTIANSSKHTQKLISSSNLDAPVKKGGHGRKVK